MANAEIDYTFKEHCIGEWEFGFALEYAVSDERELLSEVHGTALKNSGEDELVFNIGTRLRLSQTCKLLPSAGRGLHSSTEDEARLLAYLGLQLAFVPKSCHSALPTRLSYTEPAFIAASTLRLTSSQFTFCMNASMY